ncbi:MAG: hypothetical protein AAF443_07130 [Chlamydiota bacterium]
MSGLTSPQPSPQDWQSPSQPNSPLPSDAAWKNAGQSTAYSIDETGDFYDPFSDLNLFLAQKIKTEVAQAGSPKQWSAAIESKLLSSILPEFKHKFPKYRLGKHALKKIWDKVVYYYERVHGQKEAIRPDGQINLSFMIRENLKSTDSLPKDLPPHTYAYQIAVKISECLATLDGKRLSIDYLTKLIWAVQKHLQTDLIAIQSKPPYEEYDNLDKLIVKTMLEAIALRPLSSPKALKKQLRSHFESMVKVAALARKNQLTATLSMVLAQTLESNPATATFPATKTALQSFIDYHIDLSRHNQTLSANTHTIELVQRILSLYAIATYLPKTIDPQTLTSAVRYVHSLVEDHSFSSSAGVESALLVFIHAEMHLINDQKKFSSSSEIEDQILTAYKKATALPPLNSSSHDQIERLIWQSVAENQQLLETFDPDLSALIEKELGNLLIDHPHQTFRQVISHAVRFFSQIHTLFNDSATASSFWTLWEEKVEVWVAQNTMLCRFIHFDEKNPLFEQLIEHWKTHSNGDFSLKNLSLREVERTMTLSFPILQPFSQQLRTRLWILVCYLWYTKLSSVRESSYDRFLKWHFALAELESPTRSEQEIAQAVERLAAEIVPLIPFHKKPSSPPK